MLTSLRQLTGISQKDDLSRFVRMSQDHTCYNMSVISIEVRGIANIDKMVSVLTAFNQRACRYQESQSYEELEDEGLFDEAIDETGTVAAPLVEDDSEQRRTAEQEVSKEIRECRSISSRYMGYPQDGKGKGSLG